MITHLKTQAVYVSDQEEALRFWREKLGFELKSDRPMGAAGRWIEVAPPGGQSHLVLYPRSMTPDWEQRRPSLVFACADAEATHRELAGRGVAFTQPPTKMAWGTFAQFVDPDGNEFVISDAP